MQRHTENEFTLWRFRRAARFQLIKIVRSGRIAGDYGRNFRHIRRTALPRSRRPLARRTCYHLFSTARGSAPHRPFHCNSFQLETFVFYIRKLLDDQEIEAPRVDCIRCANVEDARKKENAGGEHRPDSKANRGRDPAKGVHYGIVARRARVIPGCCGVSSPAERAGLFS
jgi:hypothetical protein